MRFRSLKRFFQVVMANLLSIALTFGTSAYFDRQKKEQEKREIVLMVMFDMHNSLESVVQSDDNIHQLMLLQRQITEDTTLFATKKQQVAELIPKPRYTASAEKIFTSSIETINTVGSIQYTQLVSEFYLFRQLYKTCICDSIHFDITGSSSATAFKSYHYSDANAKDFMKIDFSKYALVSIDLVTGMEQQYNECRQIMNITDEELDYYRQKLMEKESTMLGKEGELEMRTEEVMQLQKEINAAKKKWE